MSEDNTTQAPDTSEREELLAQAKQMGLKVRKDMSVDTLREKVREALTGKDATNDDDGGEYADSKAAKNETDSARRIRKQKEASELVRIQVTCMNPNKSEYDGEIVTAGNRIVGTFKKFVKFGVEYHVPRIIYNVLRDRKCQVFVTERDEKGRQIRKGKQINEFNIAVLPPLTETELKELAQRQAMAKGQAA